MYSYCLMSVALIISGEQVYCTAVMLYTQARTCRLVVEERSAWQHSLSVFMQSQILVHSLSTVLCDSIQQSDSRLIKSGPGWPLSRLWLGYRVTAVMRLVSDSGQWGVRAVSWLDPMCDEISSDGDTQHQLILIFRTNVAQAKRRFHADL